MWFSGWGWGAASGGNRISPSHPPRQRRWALRVWEGAAATAPQFIQLPVTAEDRDGKCQLFQPETLEQRFEQQRKKKKKNLVILFIILRKVTIAKERWAKLEFSQALRRGE